MKNKICIMFIAVLLALIISPEVTYTPRQEEKPLKPKINAVEAMTYIAEQPVKAVSIERGDKNEIVEPEPTVEPTPEPKKSSYNCDSLLQL